MNRTTASAGTLLALFAVSASATDYTVIARPNRTVLGAAGVASSLVFDLPYSRKHETEADDLGYEAMIKAGFNPQGMVDVFQMLKDSESGGKTPEFLSDHPSDDKRIDRIRDKIAEDSRRFPPQKPLNLPKGKS